MPLGRATDALLTQQGMQFAPALEAQIAQAMKFERVVVLVDEQDRRRAHVIVQGNTADAHERLAKLTGGLERLGISASIAVLERIPMTPTGKPDRARLRKQLGAQQQLR
ncbi:hypothetical protein D3C80_1505850 [compost metagenome]